MLWPDHEEWLGVEGSMEVQGCLAEKPDQRYTIVEPVKQIPQHERQIHMGFL